MIYIWYKINQTQTKLNSKARQTYNPDNADYEGIQTKQCICEHNAELKIRHLLFSKAF